MNARHTSVSGDSGSGKTTLLRELHDRNNELGVFLNYDDGHLGGIAGRTVRNPAEMNDAVRECRSARDVQNLRFDYHTSSLEDAANEVAAWARQLSKDAGRQIPISVTVDESQRIMHQSQGLEYQDDYPNGLWWILHEGRDLNIRANVATQDPQVWNYTPIKQCVHRVVVGKWAVEHKSYLKKFELWNHRDGALPSENYEYTVFDKQANPTFSGRTRAEYGDDL